VLYIYEAEDPDTEKIILRVQKKQEAISPSSDY